MTQPPLPVLWVDDEAIGIAGIIDVLTFELNLRSVFAFDQASTGNTAVEKLTAHFYPIVISDLSVPSPDGPELYYRLRAGRISSPAGCLPYGKLPYFIFFTGLPQRIHMELSDEIKADPHLWILEKFGPARVLAEQIKVPLLEIQELNARHPYQNQ